MNAELRDLALTAARAAVALIAEHRAQEVEVAATKSTSVDVVTEADRAAELLIREILGRARPLDEILGEEGGTSTGSSGVRWIVDPIDGTVNFLYRIPHYAVSIAAEVDGVVEVGVVINAATGAEYVAADGSVSRDGQPIRVAAAGPLAERLILTGFSYQPEQRAIQGARVARLLPNIRDIRRLGSCALDLCHVADGSADGYVEEGVNLWDYAAGALIARTAGALVEVVDGVGGRPMLMAAPADGFSEFRAAVESAGFLDVARE